MTEPGQPPSSPLMGEPASPAWHKHLTLIIAILAFAASAMSAVAAWKSQSTAKLALDVQRAVADSGGARIEVDQAAILQGDCESESKDRLRVEIGIRNTGHITGYVIGLRMNLVPADDVINSATIAEIGLSPIAVPPQGIKRIDLPLNCAIVQSRISGGRGDPAEFRSIMTSPDTNSKINWFIFPMLATTRFQGFEDSFQVHVVSAR